MSNPHEWRIASDKEGFFIEDEFGEEILPPWLPMSTNLVSGEITSWRCQSMATAESVLALVVKDALDNYEPPDSPGWEGGFAENR
jgi:hypothetical protein